MARRKLTEEEKETIRLKEVEEHLQYSLKSELKNFQPYPPPSRLFKVGDLVNCGNHPNTEILEVHNNGRVYRVKHWGIHLVYGMSEDYYTERYCSWYHLLPLSSKSFTESFIKNKDIQIDFSNMMVDSAISCFYSFGIDMNPSYQRDYVWSVDDQVALIDSIFNNRNIGSYILCHNGYDKDLSYEILDGKQRLKALIDFFEDKFRYNGKLFSELSNIDRNHFENFHFSRATIKDADESQKIKIFIHVNTTGKHMSQEHLEKVKGMLTNGNE